MVLFSTIGESETYTVLSDIHTILAFGAQI